MNRSFSLDTDLDPRGLAINLRFRNKQIIHPRVRAAQDALITLIKQAIQKGGEYEPCRDCAVELVYTFPTTASDIDGPIKRTLDAIQMAHKSLGHTWHDNRISHLNVVKTKGEPGMFLGMRQRR